ncbi:MAG: DUF4388 domain-containing protein, partial [Holophagales bacterium]|nr:DUF4388 domain-containing protein [Holophagales bacterium]
MPTSFQYQGTLEESSLAEMLWTIYRHKVPGVVEISNEGITKKIYVASGDVIHAASTDRTDRLGAYLYRVGRLSRNDLADTMRAREQSGKRHGQVLLERGLLTPAELYASIRSQMESIIWSLFSWTRGDVSFRIGEVDDPL